MEHGVEQHGVVHTIGQLSTCYAFGSSYDPPRKVAVLGHVLRPYSHWSGIWHQHHTAKVYLFAVCSAAQREYATPVSCAGGTCAWGMTDLERGTKPSTVVVELRV